MKNIPKWLIYFTGGVIGLSFVASLLVHNYVACVWETIAFTWFALAMLNRSIIDKQSKLIERSLGLLKEQQELLNEILKSNEPTK